MVSRRAWWVLVLLIVAAPLRAGGGERIAVVRGERSEVPCHLDFTFWKDAGRSRYGQLAQDRLGLLAAGHRMTAAPGLDAQVTDVGVTLDWGPPGRRRDASRYPIYSISARVTVKPGASCPLGPGDVELHFPMVLEARKQMGAVSPDASTTRVEFEVFPSRQAVLTARSGGLALSILLAIAMIALGSAGCGWLLGPSAGGFLFRRAVMLMVILVGATACVLMLELAALMHWLSGAGSLATLVSVIALNLTMGGAVWLSSLRRPGRTECLVPIVALGLAFTGLQAIPSLSASRWAGVPIEQDEVNLAAFAVLPALVVLLAGAPASGGRKFGGGGRRAEAQAPDGRRRDATLASLGIGGMPADLPEDVAQRLVRCRQDLFMAHAHADARRPDEAVAKLEQLFPAIAGVATSDQPPLRAAAYAVHGMAFESADMQAQALEKYNLALKEVPGHAFAEAAIARLERA